MQSLKFMKRFLDHIFMIFISSTKKLHCFIEEINQIHKKHKIHNDSYIFRLRGQWLQMSMSNSYLYPTALRQNFPNHQKNIEKGLKSKNFFLTIDGGHVRSTPQKIQKK